AEDGIRDFHVTGVQTLLFRSVEECLNPNYPHQEARHGTDRCHRNYSRWNGFYGGYISATAKTITSEEVESCEAGSSWYDSWQSKIGRASCRERRECVRRADEG